MSSETQDGMRCAEFEALLNDALDGTLAGAGLENFQRHRGQCAVCGPLFAEAEAGMNFLHGLSDVEPPVQLLENILAATSGVPMQRTLSFSPKRSLADKLGQRLPWLAPVFNTVLQPRFAMSFAMAFFSLSAVLNVAGWRITSVRKADLRPSAMVRTYNETTGRVVKYYENLRFVYEIESRVRELKRDAAPERERKPREQKKEEKQKPSGEPDQKQYQNYSRDDAQPILASAPDPLPGLRTADPTVRRLS